jgi:DNA invertase Pin-like site-specific DNA recombinase
VRQLGYTRVSTSSQDAQLQLDALVAAGVQKRDVFADVTSGSKTAIERPGMKRLLEYAQEGDTVVVWRVDRLGGSLIDVLNTVTLLRDRGVHVRSIADGIDPATSTGRMMLNMLATLAEYERELIVERVNAGIAAARRNGTRFGRPTSDPVVTADNWRSPGTPARRDEPPKTLPASSAGAAQRSTDISKPSLQRRTPTCRRRAMHHRGRRSRRKCAICSSPTTGRTCCATAKPGAACPSRWRPSPTGTF